MISVLNVFWIPSVLAAWPAAWLIESIRGRLGLSGSPTLDRVGLVGMLLIDILTLLLVFLSMRTLHRNAVAHRSRNRWMATCASPTGCIAMWLLVQPFVLALLGWPELFGQMEGVAGHWTGKLILSAVPTVLFLLVLFDRFGWKCLKGNGLGLVLIVVSFATESMAWLFQRDIALVSLLPWGNQRLEGAVWKDTFWLCATLVAAGAISSWLLPYWMIWVTGAGKMEPTFAGHIMGLWRRAGTRPPRVLLWPTGCRYSNAAIVSGFRGKRLLITDRLLLNYTMRQIEWIVLHEIAHVRRYHSYVRLLPAWIGVPALLGALQTLDGWLLVLAMLSIGVVFGILVIATCWWTEMDADRGAIRMGARWFGLNHEEAASEYIHVLSRIYRDNRMERTSWTHPSLQQRIAPYQSPVAC
ncbi:M48 family metalloprotease [Pirellulaceae bacterium SH467]|jgi:Zn-dependent protease with chaperone function